ncbi:anaerobic ribonucleoside-triphosphate reductase activating protein [Halarcobacter sp.]|uniref:anaerobic ribonucleoside-triphosphate reductase activating protein n=1 Tax=Halarcobacter sp. TaxID=2321133 RepID=UPI0029F595AF|nr:anaerobic ribonucleoside-triphosphate reductase activating protein [Halarcobacter sp.]
MKKIIYNITPFTTVDFKDHLSCIAWFISCNMRCKYCYNPDIVNSKSGEYTVEDLIDFLKRRVGLLDSVVLSGGEATLHDLENICTKIKDLGFKIKLDTNGSNPKLLNTLIKNKLLDFVALDFKSNEKNFNKITKSYFYDKFIQSLDVLLNSNIKYEVRTTLHQDLLNENDINEMQETLQEIGYKNDYFIQNFLEVENLTNMKKSINIFDKAKVNNNLNIIYRN